MTERYAEARWWVLEEDGEHIRCRLCPRGCRLRDGQTGYCRVRRRSGATLLTLSYAHPTGFAIDPIEKKPLFHFLPGSQILSFGTLGCTLDCDFCQNWTHSHPNNGEAGIPWVPPAEVVGHATGKGIPSIAYTYNEPTSFGEYVVDVSAPAHKAGIRNVAVTNGYVTETARREIFANIDAANVDLKAFSEEFYQQRAQGRLEPVLDTIEWIARETRIWLEVTTLLIPGLNDSDEMLMRECEWLLEKLGADVPLHFTAFHPDFRLLDISPTPPATIARARQIARGCGIRHVYAGNVADTEGMTTYCPGCGAVLIERDWHRTRVTGMAGSRCGKCEVEIAGVWK
jgi:pyruvate formate lyase activating enzyme